MTREFWVWQFEDGELNEQPFGSLAECERDAIGYDGHPVQLVPISKLEAAQKDVARIDFIETSGSFMAPRYRQGFGGPIRFEVDNARTDTIRTADTLREAIDAAIAAQQGRSELLLVIWQAATAAERERCAKIVAEELLLPKSAYAIRKERMTIEKPPITLEQFRAIAHRTATTYRHRSDPERSSYAFVDGTSLDDFWRAVCKAIQEQNE